MKRIKITELFEPNTEYVGRPTYSEGKPALAIHSKESWEKVLEGIDKIGNIDNQRVRDFNRFVLAGASKFRVNKRGKPKLPKNIKKRMRIPIKYKEVLIGEDEILPKALFDSTGCCIISFISQNRLVEMIRKFQYRK